MKIDEFITKHSLALFQSFPEDGPSVVETIPKMAPLQLLPEEKNDHFLIYTNADRSIWVSKNTSKSLFRIRYSEDVVLTSDWLYANIDYKMPKVG